MSKYKYEWPYIQYLSIEDRKEYESDLPENLEDLEVHHIVTSHKFRNYRLSGYENSVYVSPEEYDQRQIKFDNSMLWLGIYLSVLAKAVWSSTRFYNTNILENYKVFRAETWGGYFQRRFWPVFIGAWTIYHFVGEKRFINYPKILSN